MKKLRLSIPVAREALHSMVVNTYRLMCEKQLFLVASSLAYTTLLSIIPLLAVSFALFHAFGGMEKLYDAIRPIIISNLAESSGDTAMETIEHFIGNIHAGALGISGLIGLFITSISMFSSAEKAINQIWNTEAARPLFQRIAYYWFFISLGPFGFAIILGVTSGTTLSWTKAIPSGFWGFLMIAALFFSIYKWVPHRKVNWTPPLIAGLVTALGWQLARFGYHIYVKNFVSYDKVYGALGAIPIFLLWIYIVWIIILSGAALAAILQKRFDL